MEAQGDRGDPVSHGPLACNCARQFSVCVAATVTLTPIPLWGWPSWGPAIVKQSTHSSADVCLCACLSLGI